MNLQNISTAFCGTPLQRPQIFEAIQPVLRHPDKSCPIQVLRISPA